LTYLTKAVYQNTQTILTCYATFIIAICLNLQASVRLLYRTQIGWYLLSMRLEVTCSISDRQRIWHSLWFM